jgi:hypothetical protein
MTKNQNIKQHEIDEHVLGFAKWEKSPCFEHFDILISGLLRYSNLYPLIKGAYYEKARKYGISI